MRRLKIALLAGGDSPEREIALQSAAQIEAALDHSKYDITVIDLHGRDWHHTAPDGRQWQVDKTDFSLTVEGERREFDYALVIIHGTPGEDGRLQGYLDMMGIPYSSCSMTSSVITFDKITTKRTLAGRGINLAREVFLRRGEAFDAARIVADLGLPLFVKPNANGSSFGVTKVHAPEELPTAIEAAFAQGDEILVEECIAGREMGCGVMIAGGKEYLFPITEIIPRKEFFDYEAKYTAGRSEEITPADIAEVEKLIADGKLNDKLAKQTVEGVLKGEGTPDEVVRKHDYKIVEDNGAIEAAVDAAFEANPDVVEKLKSGNMKPMGVIIGAVMKATRGQADAKAVTKVVMGKIKG